MGDVGFDPNKSKVSDDTMGAFIRENITGEITEVPGIGPGAAKKLAASEDQITNTYQLIGKFLVLKGPDEKDHKIESAEHMEKFWYWLSEVGINAHRSAIVRAIAEKMDISYPGIYDASYYENDDDDDDDE
eukprot:CAMPEP_0194278700 /NCGR_PEP_ID=MMETSP0169-20130528/11857_1 /TAXON_ID=218684 /ORGANISM="Corethron pennatum, Strain L29A3" /LENGTH=130 /DNA_ID=CAMNT_0039022947 /DNA_START=165 /DNA_END=557 /DNA_ORIENTATION=+